MAKKYRRTKKIQSLLDTLFFYFITFLSIGGLIIYLWVYTEIDESIYALEIQKITLEDLLNDIHVLQSDIDALSSSNVITKKAKEWGMVFAKPESISVHINPNNLSSL